MKACNPNLNFRTHFLKSNHIKSTNSFEIYQEKLRKKIKKFTYITFEEQLDKAAIIKIL